ncbi:MAG: ATP-binding cassette domain-containing protein, partial [Planctomycetaceae bacterium]|nr:ATP-binding cassette domain-containing protein [Planctomycetaceae bacterium]
MLQIENLTKLYGVVIGVNDMSVELPSGAYGLLGPNGSGKTTLLNIITGQLKATVGEVRILGERPWKNEAVMKRIGFCSALDILQTKTTGLEWVTLCRNPSISVYSVTHSRPVVLVCRISRALQNPIRFITAS